jgi:hypothetical protein
MALVHTETATREGAAVTTGEWRGIEREDDAIADEGGD